ncbi:MAG: sigma-70 family RNA polymerase sigma factor [Clostridia bacterium]|nr:sigma-70 family RNA polymerase sigma factor [Clostridia bacterium]
MEKESTFEALLESLRTVLERYVNFRMPTRFDAEDVLQETCLAAFLHFGELRDPALFLPWILSIARNECRLWYRKHYGREDVSLDEIADVLASPVPEDPVSDVLSGLPEEDAVLLRLTMEGWKQTEIADKLKIPLGTVKSRLYHAKKRFRDASPRN